MNSSAQIDADKNFIYIRNVTLISAFISAIGFLPNYSLVFVIFKNRSNKSLCNTYNYLLGLSCAFDMGQELATVLPAILHLGRWSITLLTCFALQWYDVFALNMVYHVMCLIALDRLMAVLFPVKYMKIVKQHSLRLVLLALLAPILHIGYYLFQMLMNALANARTPVYCQTGDYSRTYTYLGGLIVNFSTIGIYILIWIILKFGRSFHASNRRIFKSLVLIGVVHFICWATPFSAPFILPLFGLDPATMLICQRFLGIGVRISATLNIFVIFSCSGEYRDLLIKEFKFYSIMAKIYRNLEINEGGQQLNLQQTTMYKNS